MDHAAAVELLGNARETSRDTCAMNLRKIWAELSSKRVWLWLLVVFITVAFLALIYVFKSATTLRMDHPSGAPVPDSALNDQLHALQLSPWHNKEVGENGVCNTSECVHAAYHLLFGVNHAADPCDDFYDFTCGNWVKLYKEQGLDYNSHMQEMSMSENTLVIEILMSPPDSFEFQPVKTAVTFFHQCVNEDSVDPLVDLTTKLGGWPSLEGETWNEEDFDIVTALAFIHRKYLFSVFVGVDLAPPGVNETLYMLQLHVPEFTPEDKLRNASAMNLFKSLYNDILCELTGVTGYSGQWLQDADEIFQLEKALAEAVTVPVENANASNAQGTFTVAEFQEYLDGSLNLLNKPVSNNSISWKRLLNEIFSTSGVQISDDQMLIVADLGYFSRMTQILDATPKRIIGNYVFSSLAVGLLPETSSKMRQMVEEFALQIGQPLNLQSRGKHCFDYTMGFFGIPLMHEYLKTKPNLEARAVVEQMATNIQGTFDQLLESNDWLSDAAKLTVQKKLRALKTFIGYPNWLLNATVIEDIFEGLHLDSNFIDTLGNVLQWRNDQTLRQLGQSPYDLDEPWFTLHQIPKSFSIFNEFSLVLPSEVQGYHFVVQNYLVLSMGFIQPHHFYNNVPSYVNYGKTGTAIGHEIIHGFDPSGKNYDENGQFNNQSWTDEDEENYEEKSNCFRDQYNKFEIFPGVHLNGSGGLDENIADNDGLKLAYLTYKKEHARNGSNHQSLPGFEKLSAEQIFFLSYGSLWCEHGTDAVWNLLLQDPHSPGKYRINGALQNSREFADAWNCPADAPMNPVKKCTLW